MGFSIKLHIISQDGPLFIWGGSQVALSENINIPFSVDRIYLGKQCRNKCMRHFSSVFTVCKINIKGFQSTKTLEATYDFF